MVDNYNEIRKFLRFDRNLDFYFLQIMQRRKDHPNSEIQNSRIIKDYYIESIEYFDKIESEVKTFCDTFKARAGIRLNRRNFEEIGNKFMIDVVTKVATKNPSCLKRAYSSVCGLVHSESKQYKSWIVDLDTKNNQEVREVLNNGSKNIRGCQESAYISFKNF